MKFTIVMPLLNGEEYLDAAIKSIVSQSYSEWELIIVDGGSTDASLEIVRAYLQTESKISLLDQTSLGIYGAIFEGFERSKGDILAWLNCDDLYPSWALSTVAKYLADRPNTSWVNGFPGVWDDDGDLDYILAVALWPQKFIKRGYFHPELLGCIQAESTFFRKELYQKLSNLDREGILQSKLAGDYLLWRSFAKSAKLETIPTLLGGFRVHGANRSISGISAYMKEVYSMGVGRPPRRVGIFFGQLFRMIATVWSYRKSKASGAIISAKYTKNYQVK